MRGGIAKEGRQRRGFSGQDDKKITTEALTDQFGRIYPTEGFGWIGLRWLARPR
jgi:hypothetical protein